MIGGVMMHGGGVNGVMRGKRASEGREGLLE